MHEMCRMQKRIKCTLERGEKWLPKKMEDSDIWAQASERYARRKLKELIEKWECDRKAKKLPHTYQDLAEELHYSHRNSVGNWLSGKSPPPWDNICQYFNVDHSYFVAKNLDELGIADEGHHRRMQKDAARIADECGVSNSFLWYLKSDQRLQDQISYYQVTDLYLNPLDPDVPDVHSPYQIIDSNGGKAYLTEESLTRLGRIEPEVKKYLEYQIWKEFKTDSDDE